jgi:hypothetical protein
MMHIRPGVQRRQLPTNNFMQLQRPQLLCHNQHLELILMQIMDMVQPLLGLIISITDLLLLFQL